MILIGFDLDETLIHTNHDKDKLDLYTKINDITFNERTYNLFKKIYSKSKEKLFILTSRPPECKEQIKNIFGIDKVFTNNTGFRDKNDLDKNIDNIDLKTRLVIKKLEFMENLSKDLEYIIYYDDLYNIFWKLNKNIKIMVMKPL
jgi:hydroxymethylpyrimidine pyrophosphatase-like HAD family hydrolase